MTRSRCGYGRQQVSIPLSCHSPGVSSVSNDRNDAAAVNNGQPSLFLFCHCCIRQQQPLSLLTWHMFPQDKQLLVAASHASVPPAMPQASMYSSSFGPPSRHSLQWSMPKLTYQPPSAGLSSISWQPQPPTYALCTLSCMLEALPSGCYRTCVYDTPCQAHKCPPMNPC